MAIIYLCASGALVKDLRDGYIYELCKFILVMYLYCID